MQIVTFCNQKGGVGKSTTAFHLARQAVLEGLRVLAIDLDPQANLTQALAANPVSDSQAGIADTLSTRGHLTITQVVTPGIWPNLDLAPSTGDILAAVRDELVIAGPGREHRLSKQLELINSDYDLVLIDCAPSIDQLTINALTASDKLAIVTQSKQWSTNGLATLLTTISSVKCHYNTPLTISGIIVNMHDKNTTSGARWLDELKVASTELHVPVFEPPIPKRVVIADSVEASTGLDEYPGGTAELEGIYQSYLQRIME